jgi:hypothetical protein
VAKGAQASHTSKWSVDNTCSSSRYVAKGHNIETTQCYSMHSGLFVLHCLPAPATAFYQTPKNKSCTLLASVRVVFYKALLLLFRHLQLQAY